MSPIGLPAVVWYTVGRRVQEIGVRAVLGADRTDIVWLIGRERLAIASVGAAIGVALAHTAVRATASLFEGMPRLGVITALLVPLGLVALVTAAGYIPARRAARIDPVDALRSL